MPETEPIIDDLQAAITDQTILIRVTGRGSFKIAAPLKQFIAKIASRKQVDTVVIDLKECVGMDSTFMGVLAGLSGRLKASDQTLELIHLSAKNAELLKTLGIDQVLSFYEDAHGHQFSVEAIKSVPTNQASKKEMAVTALEAHEELAQISDENLPRFKRVIEFLKEDVDRLD